MGKAKGRPRKSGKRHPNGKLVRAPANDRGNDVVQARAKAFTMFQGGKADQQVSDPIGRIWAVGLLDGERHDSAILRDMGRRYAALYWHEFYEVAPRISETEPRSRSGAVGENVDDRPGETFRILDRLARSAGHAAVSAMHELCVDGWWFPDQDPLWVERLVTEARIREQVRRVSSGKPSIASIIGPLPITGDHFKLGKAVAALVAMVDG